MVVLAAAICNKAGKAVVSRQFIEMSRSRIESLLASFPKLVASVGGNDQHTFVEDETVRFVYQPLDDNISMVLITNKQSNILQDIETLQLFARAVADVCRVVDEREASRYAFHLISVFDEIVSLGYKEDVTLAQIRTIIQMESHEERVQAEIERNKIKEVKDELRHKQRQLELKKLEAGRRGVGSGAPGGYGGYGPSSGGSSAPKAYGSHVPGAAAGPTAAAGFSAASPSAAPQLGPSRGMQLGRRTAPSSELAATLAVEAAAPAAAAAPVAAPTFAAAPSGDAPVRLVVAETTDASVSREGAVEHLEVKGELSLWVADPAHGALRVALDLSASAGEAVQFRTHPNVDKAAFANEAAIALRDASQSFPVNQSLGVLKWRLGGAAAAVNENKLPLWLHFWPSDGANGATNVIVELELGRQPGLELRDVTVLLPVPGNAPPAVASASAGSYALDPASRTLTWQLPLVDAANSAATLEFSVPGLSDADALFPVAVSYRSERLLCPVRVSAVTAAASGRPISYTAEAASRSGQFRFL